MMERRRYRKVSARMYADERFSELSRPQPNGQSLWIYLLTGPHTTSVPGLFVAGEAQLAEALGWPVAGFRKAWQEIADANMAQADWRARVVWLPNAIAHNLPDNPNVVRGWLDAIDEIPACALKTAALDRLAAALASLGEPFLKPFTKRFRQPFQQPLQEPRASGLPQGSRIQDQEQDQEQKKERAVSLPVMASPDPFTDAAVTERAGRFIERYEASYAKHRKGAKYLVQPQRDYNCAVRLCQTWTDDTRLDKLVAIFLTTDHKFAEEGSRTIPQFAALASWCDSKLAEWEGQQVAS